MNNDRRSPKPELQPPAHEVPKFHELKASIEQDCVAIYRHLTQRPADEAISILSTVMLNVLDKMAKEESRNGAAVLAEAHVFGLLRAGFLHTARLVKLARKVKRGTH